MANVKINTTKIKEISSTINSNINDYVDLINSLFDTYEHIVDNNVWVGNSADEFVKDAKVFRSKLLSTGNELKKYSKALDNLGNKTELYLKNIDN